jgi:hypothetical protein
MAETLKEAAATKNVSIAVLLDSLRSKIVDLLPMPPSEGPPLPRKMGVRWPGKTGKGS